MFAPITFGLVFAAVVAAGCGANLSPATAPNGSAPARGERAATPIASPGPAPAPTPIPEPIASPPSVELAELATGMLLRGTGGLREQAVACRDLDARRAPVASVGFVTATRPLRDVEVSLTSSANLLLMVTGPLAEDGSLVRGGKVRCGRNAWRMELDGRYRVHVVALGNSPPDGTVHYAVGFRLADSRVDLAADAAPVPAGLPVAARQLVDFYPWLLAAGGKFDHHPPSEWQRVFSGADPALFVYPRVDLDPKLASWYQPNWVDATSIVFPRKDEPLLVARFLGDRAWVIAADGGRFTIPTRYLVATPSGAVQLPEKVRNTVLNWIEAKAVATADDQLAIAELDKLKQRFTECRKEVFARSRGPGINAYDWDVVTYVNGRVRRVENLGDKISRQADQKCKKPAVEGAQTRVFERLVTGYIARSQAQLDTIRARFASRP